MSISPSRPMLTTPLLSLNRTAEGGEDERCRVPDGGLEYRTYKRALKKVSPLQAPVHSSRWVPAAKSRARLPSDQLDQLRGRYEQQDDREQHIGELKRHVRGELHLLCTRVWSAPNRSAPRITPTGWLRPRSATPMPLKPRLVTKGNVHVAVDPEHLDAAPRASQRAPPMASARTLFKPEPHAGVVRSPGREADRA